MDEPALDFPVRMKLLEACHWLETSWLGNSLRESTWGFAIIEMVHLLALALMGAALLVTGLSVFGFVLKDGQAGAITRDLRRVLLGSFVAMIISGSLLFADGPLRYYGNSAFRTKLLLIAAAAATGLVVHLSGIRGTPMPPTPTVKALALLSLTLWLGAAVAGRVIGVL